MKGSINEVLEQNNEEKRSTQTKHGAYFYSI